MGELHCGEEMKHRREIAVPNIVKNWPVSSVGRKSLVACCLLMPLFAGSCDSVAPDTTPPTVTSSSPPNASVGVLLNSAVTAAFSEAINQTTINTTNLKIAVVSTGAAVPSTVSYDSNTHIATLTPSAQLSYDTSYVLTITTGVTDLAGNPLAANYTSSFHTIQNVSGKPYFQGTNTITDTTQARIHVHLRFTQSGQTLGHPADCEKLPVANCDLLPRNSAGATAIGTLDDQGIAATVTDISGTFTDPGITFTFKLANGRTFSYTGTVSNSLTMSGTLSGATLLAPIPMGLSRLPEPADAHAADRISGVRLQRP
jgi:Bacterial Ig-like domain